MPQDMVNVKR